MKTRFHRLSDVVNSDTKKQIKFTHTLDTEGTVVVETGLANNWDNIMLLDGKRDCLYQYLVWDDIEDIQYFVLLSKDLYVD